MKSLGKKSAATISMILISTIALTLFALPLANAHTPPWQIVTYAYTTAQPNPVGVGQEYCIPKGLAHAGEYSAGTRTIYAFGGKRVKREIEE